MYATLTLPAGQDFAAPRRPPTVRVRSVDEIRNALRQARVQALTLDASGMDRILRMDTARGLLEVQAARKTGLKTRDHQFAGGLGLGGRLPDQGQGAQLCMSAS